MNLRRRSQLTLIERQTNPVVRTLIGIGTWLIVLLFFFPVLWMALTGFKSEETANTSSPHFIFKPTLSEFKAAWQGGGGSSAMRPFLEHSLIVTIASTLVVLLLAIPAAYVLSLAPVPNWRDALFFFISTKMLPIVGAIVPLSVIAIKLDILDTTRLLFILYISLNLPIAVWMMRSFLLEVPVEIIEASRVDGASLPRQLWSVVLPVAMPGLAATALICFIFAWNEFFLAVSLTTTNGATMPIFLLGAVQTEGPFIAHLSAAATAATLPVLIAGWAAQDKLVRGLSMGAVK